MKGRAAPSKVFGVLNVLVGVFVDSAMATASMDKSILEQEAEIRESLGPFGPRGHFNNTPYLI